MTYRPILRRKVRMVFNLRPHPVGELLEFAASIRAPGDGAVDVTPEEEEE